MKKYLGQLILFSVLSVNVTFSQDTNNSLVQLLDFVNKTKDYKEGYTESLGENDFKYHSLRTDVDECLLTRATDGTMSISSGVLTGGVTGDFSGDVTAVNFNGVATSAKYADMAEIYSADADYEAGTVVKIGGEAEITQTTEHADADVFGVISTNPAYLMNSEAEGLPVALAGRVPVKVVGKVAKGERLVASDEPGMAWALGSDDYDTRAIIGRSLEDKDDGGIGLVEAVIGVK